MNGSAARADRRNLRRAVGVSALSVIDQQSDALRTIVPTLNQHETRLNDLERLRIAEANIRREFFARSFWARWRWLLTGR